MEEKFLNEGCIFRCSNCPAVRIKPQEVSVHRTKIDGRTALTTTTQMLLITPGICPNLPQTGFTPNCVSPIIPGNWTKFSKNTAGGVNMLIESSEFVCSLGQGRIIVDNNAVKDVVQGSYSGFVLTSLGMKDSDKLSNNSSAKTVTEKSQDKNIGGNEDKDNKKQEKKNEEEDLKEIEDLYCPYDKEKEKCRDCRYAKANADHMDSASIAGDSRQPGKILRDNYENEFGLLASTRKKFKKQFRSVDEEYGLFNKINCGTAAHHILSTKDVYEQNRVKYVLKLANFYEYNVNEAYNCIILPGLNAYEERHKSELQAKFGKETDYEKKKFKFFSMRESGRQWHGGGHGKDFENENNIHCYATEVTNLLNKYMRNMTKQHCRIEPQYYDKDKETFVLTIHKIIDIVRDKLMAFETKPQNSLPYFVSADAYYYAFHALNIRLLVFRKVDDGIEVYKYTITRKNGNTYPDERGNRIFKYGELLWEKRLVAFCGQIDIAYIDISQGKLSLPFDILYVKEISLRGIGVKEYLKANIASIEAELEDVKNNDGETIKRRLGQLRG